ncbi:hypothetical protein OHR68_43375 [Spirillospora sp. NBC_00431]
MTALVRRIFAPLVDRIITAFAGLERRPPMVVCGSCGVANDPDRGSLVCFTCHRPLYGSSD